MTQIYYNESLMQHDCLRRIRAQGVITAIEIQHFNHMIDLAWITNSRIYAVELKLTDWKVALEQAKYHLDIADFVSVAMPPRRMTKPIKEAFEECGVGFLEYQRPDDFGGNDFSHPFVVQLMPRQNEVHPIFRLNYKQEIKDRIIRQHNIVLNEAKIFVKAFSEVLK